MPEALGRIKAQVRYEQAKEPDGSNCIELDSEAEAVERLTNSLALASNALYFTHCAFAFSVTNHCVRMRER